MYLLGRRAAFATSLSLLSIITARPTRRCLVVALRSRPFPVKDPSDIQLRFAESSESYRGHTGLSPDGELKKGARKRNSFHHSLYHFHRPALSMSSLDDLPFKTMNSLSSISEFCRHVSNNLHRPPSSTTRYHLVLGNPAGDADSIISALGLAYVDTICHERQLQQQQDCESEVRLIVPIVSIPIQDLQTQRPETMYLLRQCAGMTPEEINDNLIGIDQALDLFSTAPASASTTDQGSETTTTLTTTLTLVDHNHFFGKNQNDDWTVTEILDHHLDEGYHVDTCRQRRNIAFEDSKPLVASTCTLVVERFYEHNSATSALSIPPTLAILLLGVILLDSINLLPGKGTPRDVAAVDRLLRDTDWTRLGLPDEITIATGDIPDPTRLFACLQSQKFSPEFWNGLSAEQAIRMDFKSFDVPVEAVSLGIATILQDMDTFWKKKDVISTMAKVIDEDDLQVLGLMCTSMVKDDTDTQKPRRQLVLASRDKMVLTTLLEFLTNGPTPLDVDLQLSGAMSIIKDTTNLYYVKAEQGNAAASRKQVAPVLVSFWKDNIGSVAVEAATEEL